MISKAIIVNAVNSYKYTVRIPTIDGISTNMHSTKDEDLSVATCCALPGYLPIYTAGDVVLVGYEDNDLAKPVILGLLYCAKVINNESYSQVNATKLQVQTMDVTSSLTAPQSTTIGNIKYTDLNDAVLYAQEQQK